MYIYVTHAASPNASCSRWNSVSSLELLQQPLLEGRVNCKAGAYVGHVSTLTCSIRGSQQFAPAKQIFVLLCQIV